MSLKRTTFRLRPNQRTQQKMKVPRERSLLCFSCEKKGPGERLFCFVLPVRGTISSGYLRVLGLVPPRTTVTLQILVNGEDVGDRPEFVEDIALEEPIQVEEGVLVELYLTEHSAPVTGACLALVFEVEPNA